MMPHFTDEKTRDLGEVGSHAQAHCTHTRTYTSDWPGTADTCVSPPRPFPHTRQVFTMT